MPPPRKLLVVDSNVDNGALLVRSLARRFPASSIELCRDSGIAIKALTAKGVDAVVLHRTDDGEAAELIRLFLKAAPEVPIVGVSGVDRSESLFRAGAVGFLNYDEWLRIGTVVANVLENRSETAT